MTIEIVIPTPDFETKIRVLHAVDRPINSISLDELCTKAAISRQTFYKHFDSKYSIALWYSNFCATHFLFQVGRRYTWHDGLELHFAMLCKELDFLTFSATGNLRKQLGNEQSHRLREEWLFTLGNHEADVSRELAFYVAIFSSTLVTATGEWLLDTSRSISVDEHVQWLEHCIPQPLQQAMDARIA